MIDGEALLVGEHLVGHVILKTRVLLAAKIPPPTDMRASRVRNEFQRSRPP
jgi:hypothetical protein